METEYFNVARYCQGPHNFVTTSLSIISQTASFLPSDITKSA